MASTAQMNLPVTQLVSICGSCRQNSLTAPDDLMNPALKGRTVMSRDGIGAIFKLTGRRIINPYVPSLNVIKAHLAGLSRGRDHTLYFLLFNTGLVIFKNTIPYSTKRISAKKVGELDWFLRHYFPTVHNYGGILSKCLASIFTNHQNSPAETVVNT